MPRTRTFLAAALLVAAAACNSPAPGASDKSASTAAPPAAVAAADATLSVSGATNSSPSIAANGQDVVVAWAATKGDATDIYAATSHDGAVTFSAPVRVNDLAGDARVTGEQAPRVAAAAGQIVVAWTSRLTGQSRVRLARSTDGGVTFRPAVTLHDLNLTGARGWASVAIDGSGAVHAVWLDGRDGMAGMTHAAGAAESHAMHGSMRQDVFETTWSPDGKRSEVRLATNVCFCCKTSVSVGPDGAVFAAWRNIYPTNIRDMAVARSTDAGKTFGAPVRVSEDHWQIDACPEDGPSIAVTADGVLHIVWPTIVGGTDVTKAIFYSESADGGATFTPRVRVDGAASRASAHPQLVTTSDGLLVVWDETGEGHRVIRGRLLHPSKGAAPTMDVVPLNDPHGTYPAPAAVGKASVIAWGDTVDGVSSIRLRRLSR